MSNITKQQKKFRDQIEDLENSLLKSDDNRVAKQNGIGSLTLVDKQGKFVKEVSDFAGMYVKDEFYSEDEEKPNLSVDIQIIIKLKKITNIITI